MHRSKNLRSLTTKEGAKSVTNGRNQTFSFICVGVALRLRRRTGQEWPKRPLPRRARRPPIFNKRCPDTANEVRALDRPVQDDRMVEFRECDDGVDRLCTVEQVNTIQPGNYKYLYRGTTD